MLQIDWAPTLSILAGVSPFYDTPALPNLDLLELPDEVKANLLQKYNRAITGTSVKTGLDELRASRSAFLARDGSVFVGGFVALATLLAGALVSHVALRDHVSSWRPRSAILVMAFISGYSSYIARGIRAGVQV